MTKGKESSPQDLTEKSSRQTEQLKPFFDSYDFQDQQESVHSSQDRISEFDNHIPYLVNEGRKGERDEEQIHEWMPTSLSDFEHYERSKPQANDADELEAAGAASVSTEQLDFFVTDELKQTWHAQQEALSSTMRDGLQVVADQVSSLESQVARLTHEFQTKFMVDKQRDTIIDSLHRELQQYKDKESQDRFLPLIRDLIVFLDRMEHMAKVAEKDEIQDPKKVVEIINNAAQDIEDILYRQGIESLPLPKKQKFDSKRQKLVKAVKTSDPEKDKQVAGCYGRGYVWDGRQIRQELVSVYVYQPESEK